jgi:hypothetical protein
MNDFLTYYLKLDELGNPVRPKFIGFDIDKDFSRLFNFAIDGNDPRRIPIVDVYKAVASKDVFQYDLLDYLMHDRALFILNPYEKDALYTCLSNILEDQTLFVKSFGCLVHALNGNRMRALRSITIGYPYLDIKDKQVAEILWSSLSKLYDWCLVNYAYKKAVAGL